MREVAVAIAHEARRAGLLAALRHRRGLTLEQLDQLVREGAYAHVLRDITVGELREAEAAPALPQIRDDEAIEDAVMRVFSARKYAWLSSGFFVRHLGLRRWTAQKVLAGLADEGLLERRGVTSGTRYRLAQPSPARAPQGTKG
jgi:hypothetical protein